MITFFAFTNLSREPYEYEDEPRGRLVKYVREDPSKYYYVLEYFTWDTAVGFAVVYLAISLIILGTKLLWGRKHKKQPEDGKQ